MTKKSHVANLHARLRKKHQGPNYMKLMEEEFQTSWDRIEQLYDPHPLNHKIQPLIQKMRQKGYDKTLRAGQSLWTFMLSRSLRHGLQPKQKYIYIHFTEEGMTFGFHHQKQQQVTISEIKWDSQLEQFLRQLQKEIVT